MDQALTYEIHITGDQSIIENAQKLGWKTIEIDLLRPDGSILRREYMTSEVRKYNRRLNVYIDILFLKFCLKYMGTKIYRSKIETTPYPYLFPSAKYVEAHFEVDNNEYPISRNAKKTKILATDREYNPDNFKSFLEKHKGRELELCIYDTNVNEDKDWLDLWE